MTRHGVPGRGGRWALIAAGAALAVTIAACAGPNATSVNQSSTSPAPGSGSAGASSSSDSAGSTAPSGTATGSATAQQPARGGTLTVASLSAPSTLNPAASGNGSDAVYQQLAYAPLIMIDSHGDLVPGLATSWSYQGKDNEALAVHLRSGLKFADGTPMTADDVVASLNYFAKNGTGPAAAAFSTLTAKKVDDTTVEIDSSTPNPVIPDLISTRFMGGNIISPAGLKDPKALGAATFGAGAYVLDPAQTVTGDHYTFVPNKYFYDQGQIHFDKVVVKVVSNPSSAVQALRSGQIDYAGGDSTTVATAKAAGLTVLHAPESWEGAFILDSGGQVTPALKSQQVRQAMNLAIDRKSIASAIFGEYATAVMQPNDPGFDAFDPALEGTYPYDPQKAKDLLAKAGYPQGFSFTWAYPTYESQTAQVVQAMAGQLAKVGIKAQLKGAANLSELITMLTSKKYSLWSLAWGGQSQFANTKQVWLPDSQVNPFKNETPGLNAAFDAYASAPPAERDKTAQAVEKVIVDQALSIPVLKFDNIVYYNPKLKGVALQKTGEINNVLFWSE